jgi:hypothetical protein
VDWVTGAAILTHAHNRAPSPEDSEWADLVASAVNAGLDHRLEGTTWLNPLIAPPPQPPELAMVALNAGTEAYKRREAVFGLTGYVDLQGAAIRIARDYLEAQAPIIARYATFGLG